MFKQLDDELCYRALAFTLSIVSSLHDMLQYLCAFSRLGSSHARLGSRRMEFVSADWGGTEGIGLWEFLALSSSLSSSSSLSLNLFYLFFFFG